MRLLVAQRMNDEMSRVVTDKLGRDAKIDFLARADEQQRAELLSQAEIVLAMNFRRDIHDAETELLRNVRLIQITLAGADSVPFERLRPDTTICSNGGPYSDPIAEHAIGMMLSLSRNFLPIHEKLSRGDFDQTTVHKMLKGSTLGIIGFGGIGKRTADIARGFGMRILAINSTGVTDRQVEFIGTLSDLNYVLRESDFLLLSVALTKKTNALIGAVQFGLMKEDAVLVNIARGDLIDEKSLYDHLNTHSKFKAGIEAWWVEPFTNPKFEVHFPFFKLQNFLGSPHNSYLTEGIQLRALEAAVENIARFMRGGGLRNIQHREDYI